MVFTSISMSLLTVVINRQDALCYYAVVLSRFVTFNCNNNVLLNVVLCSRVHQTDHVKSLSSRFKIKK